MTSPPNWRCCATCHTTYIPLLHVLCLGYAPACFLQTKNLVKLGQGLGKGGHNCGYWTPKDNPGPEHINAKNILYEVVLTKEQ